MVDMVNVLRPCLHQVAGHMFEEGKAGSFVDDVGHFYKPLQQGPRGDRERAFYEDIASELAAEHLWRRTSSARRPSLRPPPFFPDLRELERRGDIAQRDEWGLVGSPSLHRHSAGAGAGSDGGASPHGASDEDEGTAAALMVDAWVARQRARGCSPFASSNGRGAVGGSPLRIDSTSSSSNGKASDAGREPDAEPEPQFSVLHSPLLRVIPRFYGVVTVGQRTLLELEDLARGYRHPCIVDIKIGYRTWYPEAGDEAYIARCKQKDAATTQARLGFKICGMQVWRSCQGGYWRASKRWCKTLPEALVDKALMSFTNNDAEGAAVRVRLVDFAHSFRTNSSARDDNFLLGLTSLMQRMRRVQGEDLDIAFV
ncbi:Inositol polyphosphate multikinase beta [Auxenochlorella protothecoides]|uniref:Inositol polyphosphate multikinase n=1 Tax=Auxenochlorella protothecoides TaxID=3075 RepID=A0A087SPM3_AUXPR|nr:Inositol polyphosphate multikinase beta [Auxenochlorella protothecoides]KFM27677.1 Inositol polyphosphate multikinase beta [Auxenochlorella protothecoides]